MTRPHSSLADQLRAAIRRQRVPTAVIAALKASPTDPVSGQIWCARLPGWTQLLLLHVTDDPSVLASPIMLDVAFADDSAVILAAEDTTLELPLAMWPSLARCILIRTLDRRVAELTSVGGTVLDLDKGARPRGRPIVSPIDPRAEYRARLADTMGELAKPAFGLRRDRPI